MLMRVLIRGVAALLAWAATASAQVPSGPLVDTFCSSAAPGCDPHVFFNLVEGSCIWAARGAKLSVDPTSLPPGKLTNIAVSETRPSSQGMRRVMVQRAAGRCVTDAIVEADLKLHLLTGANHTNALSKLRLAREGTNFPTVSGRLADLTLSYNRGVVKALSNVNPDQYRCPDDCYGWTYREGAIDRLREVRTIFLNAGLPSPFTPDTEVFVTRNYGMAGHVQNPTDFVSNRNTYWSSPLTDPGVINALNAAALLHAQAGRATWCVASGGDACDDPHALTAQQHAQERANLIAGYPALAPASHQRHPTLPLDALCRSIQRAKLAYDDWTQTVITQGHTVEGFRLAWEKSLGHWQEHIARAIGFPFTPLVTVDATYDPPGLNPGYSSQEQFRQPWPIRQVQYAVVPGRAEDGSCP